LNDRLLRYFNRTSRIRKNPPSPPGRPVYEYAAAFNTLYCLVYTWQGLTPKALEEILMAHFAQKHRSFPVANGAGSGDRVVG